MYFNKQNELLFIKIGLRSQIFSKNGEASQNVKEILSDK